MKKYMTIENLRTLGNLGFRYQYTGGGCEWFIRPIGNSSFSLVITDGEAGLPELTGQLFLMSDKHGEPIMQSKLMDMDELVEMLSRLL